MWKYKIIIFLLLSTSFFLMIQLPFIGDEGLYSIAIKDNIELGLQSKATYFGETMYWKPSLMFNVYAIIASPFYKLIPEEILFRTISLLFVIASLFVLFHFFKNEFNDEKKAYIGIIFILITPAFFSYSIGVLTDTLMFFFICLMLYSSQKFERIKKIIFPISIIGIGLSKSIVIAILGLGMIIGYYLNKNKINYRMLTLGFFSISLLLLYSYIIQIEKNTTTDILRIINPTLDISLIIEQIIGIIVFCGILILTLFILPNQNKWIYIFCLGFFVFLILNNHVHLPWYVFSILPFLSLLFINLNIKKEIIGVLLIYNIIFIILIFGNVVNININMYKVAYSNINLNETAYIGRMGEPLANKMYEYNGVMITPENSMKCNYSKDNKNNWCGSPEKMTNENLLGLIYDYENPKWYPYYLKDLSIEDKYLPPITRTHKNWEGPFEQIIIEEQYYVKIKEEILKDYEINKIYYKEIDEDQTIYILKRK